MEAATVKERQEVPHFIKLKTYTATRGILYRSLTVAALSDPVMFRSFATVSDGSGCVYGRKYLGVRNVMPIMLLHRRRSIWLFEVLRS